MTYTRCNVVVGGAGCAPRREAPMEQQEKFEAAVQKIADERVAWADVMAEFQNVSLEEWLMVRSAAVRYIESDLHAAGIYDGGISSSDVNHTVFGFAERLFRDGLRGSDLAVMTAKYMTELTS